jgi:two-component system chemotaxis response regulator CheB
MSTPIRVLVVDDSAVMRRGIATLLGGDASIQVVDSARNGEDALAKIAQHKPDVVTLDVEMPVMDGLTALAKIRELPEPRPAVIVCSTLTVAGSKTALQALRLGAADVLAKEPDAIGAGGDNIRRDLIARVKAVAPRVRAQAIRDAMVRPAGGATPPRELAWGSRSADLVVIGSSTGGPPILEQLLAGVRPNFPAPIVIAQHMPAMFTKSMSDRLREICAIRVEHAEEDALLQPGTAYVTVGGRHARVHKVSSAGRYRLEVSPKPAEALYKPSVNELFQSASVARERVLGIMLTGMGDDGCAGARAMHAQGATLVAQAPETCAVYGMPRSLVEAGLAHAILTPPQLGALLSQLSGAEQPARRVA